MKIGMNGSLAHVMSNDKIKNKNECLKELKNESVKDTFLALGGTAVALGAAVNADKIKTLAKTPLKEVTGNAIGLAKKAVKNPGKAASKIINSVKTNLNPEKVVNSVKALPAPAKAAIVGGLALFGLHSASKAGYIEGKHEVK